MHTFIDNFKIETPLVGLSPMDGVSDDAFRFITKKHGNPDLIITEFVNVNGMAVGKAPVYTPFIYDNSQRPILAQIYGREPVLFYNAAIIICELGFDGVDINMGCPAKNVASSGSGAALIADPERAKEIVRQTKKGVKDWVNGRTVESLDIKNRVKDAIRNIQETIELLNAESISVSRSLRPVSVKTRIGFDKPVTSEWIKHLEEVEPAFISLHGRTLKQMYKDYAHWDEIALAVDTSQRTPILGNGDISSSDTAVKRLKETGVRGILIGRGAFGNPWIFKQKEKIKKLEKSIEDYQPSIEEIKKVIIEHCERFVCSKPDSRAFVEMRKHLGWYIKGFPGAKKIRAKMVQASNIGDVQNVLNQLT